MKKFGLVIVFLLLILSKSKAQFIDIAEPVLYECNKACAGKVLKMEE
jgi:hypothetical protein